MSSIGSGDFPNPNDPDDPLHYAPRAVRSKTAPPVRPVRATSSRSNFDDMLQEAVARSRRNPLDPDFVYEPDPPRSRFSVAGGFTAAIGVMAIIGFVFFMMIPKSQGSDPTSTGTTSVNDNSQALLQKFVRFEKSQDNTAAGPAQAAPDQSQGLLQKFEQWRRKQQ